MINKDTGGQAFPMIRDMRNNADWDYESGMTLRDYFAAKAMRIMWEAYDKGYCGDLSPDTRNNEFIAQGAYQIADAMMEARK